MKKKIIFTTGGTGGHIFPAINLMKHFYKKGNEVILVTDLRGKNFIKGHSEFKSYILKPSTFTNKNLLRKCLALIVIFYSIIKAIVIIKKESPDLVFGFGGYASFPISFASKLLNFPLVIYEINMVFGLSNRFLSKFSKKIFVAKKMSSNLEEKYKDKIFEVGTILNKGILNFPRTDIIKKKKYFTILVLGGSQGAEVFGSIIPLVINELKNKGHKIEIIQQCLKEQKNSISEFYKKNEIKYKIFEFKKNIFDLILSSDLAITRCGASTTAELVHAATPFIAVPLPSSTDDHQYLNAKYYENKGCCLLLEQKNFNAKSLFNLIATNIKDQNKLDIIRQNMKKNYNKNVYADIENQLKEFI